MTDRFRIAEPVARALAKHRPVVALETTLVTHGLPHPQGVEAALALEALVREEGAEPATIGVLDGAARVGLDAGELERMATAGHTAKLGLGNFAAQLVSGEPGSTTVAATMFVAARVGIEVFATGGIGGVHRNAAETGDVSADLTALAQYPVAVVCAGAKAILDLAATVERLETLGVPVLGFGTDRFPAFYRRDSGLGLDRRCDTVAELALAIRTHWALGFTTGVVVANPIPERHELPAEMYERALTFALAEAGRAGITGRAVTPFLLERVRQQTEGGSVFSNRALLENNARLAARLARELTAAGSSREEIQRRMEGGR
jgi:pseudouridine-5'-phosphate glycosidase